MIIPTHEYRTIDKSTWGDGAWQAEPDKVQWVDEATGLDCLIVRGPSGALCGYVGVPESHPLHGKDYSGCTRDPRCEENWCDHSPESRLRVHGGLTFADACQEPTEEQWLALPNKINDAGMLAEAAKHPQGDSAERLARFREQESMTFEEWRDYHMARRICHLPEPGRPDNIWWFGFDCAHSGDLSPKYAATLRGFRDHGDEYRDIAYVQGECAQLAQQLSVGQSEAKE
jgi:hypothetical protein